MPITAGDLEFSLTGGSTNTDPDASLGGARSTQVITSGEDNNLFDDVTGDESSSGDTEYRALAFENDHGSLPLTSTKGWIATTTPSTYTEFEFAPEAPQTDSVQTIADESTAPSGVTWNSSTSKAAGFDVTSEGEATGTVNFGEWCGIWCKRVVTAGAAAYSADTVTLKVEGETAASPWRIPVRIILQLKWDEEGNFSYEQLKPGG